MIERSAGGSKGPDGPADVAAAVGTDPDDLQVTVERWISFDATGTDFGRGEFPWSPITGADGRHNADTRGLTFGFLSSEHLIA